jgi:hypothetical protein
MVQITALLLGSKAANSKWEVLAWQTKVVKVVCSRTNAPAALQ